MACAVGGAASAGLDCAGGRPAAAHVVPGAAVDRRDRAGLCVCAGIPAAHARGAARAVPAAGPGLPGRVCRAARLERLRRAAAVDRLSRCADDRRVVPQPDQISALARFRAGDARPRPVRAGAAAGPRRGRAADARRCADVLLPAASVRAASRLLAGAARLRHQPRRALRVRCGLAAVGRMAAHRGAAVWPDAQVRRVAPDRAPPWMRYL